ncbi:MAG: hypothetical protein BWY76_02021 [bacterium ADurb.Bin429]|nr:MAG: hypothetical protein BWY76_02021 [bacterium ADurb.Bin429]
MGNIAEGHGRGGDNEFVLFISYAMGSARETQSHLYVALDAEYITEVEFPKVYNQIDETCRLIGGVIQYLESSPMRGKKFAHRKTNPARQKDSPS